MPIAAAAIMGGASLGGSALGAFGGGEPTAKFPPAVREQMIRSLAQLGLLQQTRTPYQYQRQAYMSPFQLAAMGNVANQAFGIGAPTPTTSATQGPGYWQGAMSAPLTPGQAPQGAPAGGQGPGQGQAPPTQSGPAGAPTQAGAARPPATMPGGEPAYDPYANLGYASQFIPPAMLGLFNGIPAGPLYGDPRWSPYFTNTPEGQAVALQKDPRLYNSNPWAQSHPDRAMAIQDPAWVAAHPDKAQKYQQMFDASQKPTTSGTKGG